MLARRSLLPLVPLLVLGLAGALGVGPATAAGPGETVLLSGVPGLQAPVPADFAWNESAPNGDFGAAADVSADGRYVVFGSLADGLVTAAEDRRYQGIFVKDRQTGKLTDLTAGANGSSFSPTISDDGSRVAFETQATNLVPADTTPDVDVVVRAVATGATTLITDPGPDGCAYQCLEPQLSGDGSRVAFTTAAKLLPADGNGVEDVYVRSATGGGTVLVSRAGAGAGNGRSSTPSISDDGLVVGFRSSASNLVVGDAGGHDDVFVRNTATDKTVLASAASGTTTAGDGESREPALSGDGAYLAFSSSAADLGDGDADTIEDVHRRRVDRAASAAGATVLISRTPANVKANATSASPQISDDGSRVSFWTAATNLPPGIGTGFVRDVTSGVSAPLGAGPAATVVALSGDAGARVLVGARFSPALEPGLAVVDAAAAKREIVSRPSDGTPLVPRVTTARASAERGDPHALSDDGRYAIFRSESPVLPGASVDALGDRVVQLYRRDNRTGAVELVSRAADGTPSPTGVDRPSISGDGSRVAFGADAVLAPGAAGLTRKAYVRDLTAQTTVLASRSSGSGGASPNAYVDQLQLSGDGRQVLFTTNATSLDPSGHRHAYVRDLAAATTTLVDRADGPAGAPASDDVSAASISGDGRRVAFATYATNVGDGPTAGHSQVHLRDRDAGSTVLVSRGSGANGAPGGASSGNPVISADGRAVAFETDDAGLDPTAGPWPKGAQTEVAVRDLRAATTTLASRGAGAAADDDARNPSISADGAVVAYESGAGNVGNGVAGTDAVVVRRLASGEQRTVGVGAPSDPGNVFGDDGARSAGLSGDGRCLAFYAHGTGVVGDVSPDYTQAFLRVLDGRCGTPAGADPTPGGGGGGGGGGGASATPPARPLAAPRLSGVRLTATRFRVAPARPPRGRKPRGARGRTAVGTSVRFTLSAAATVSLTLSRPAPGRRVGRACRPPSHRLRHRRACVRDLPEGVVSSTRLAAGARTMAFSGRVGRRALRPGRHRMLVVATGAGGRSVPVALSFTVVRR